MKLKIDQSDPADVAAAKELAETFMRQDTKNTNPANWNSHSALNEIRNDIVQDVIAINTGNGGLSVEN
jgi:hypothetical protein